MPINPVMPTIPVMPTPAGAQYWCRYFHSFGRILTTLSEAKDSGVICTGFNLIGGGIALQAIREADENSKRTDARIKDCESQFPNANHLLSFPN